MARILVDSNVLLDIITEDAAWFGWSSETIAAHAEASTLVINPVIYGEVSVGFDRVEDLDAALPPSLFERTPIPWEAAFLAGKCFLQYKRRGGTRTSTLPDFFIGGHAEAAGISLLTRDTKRLSSYFPGVTLICPQQ